MELDSLKMAAKLCHYIDANNTVVRKPFLALAAMETQITKYETAYKQICKSYDESTKFDETVGVITCLNKWSIFKIRPQQDGKEVKYIGYLHNQNEQHLGFQFLLTGILSVYYDKTRNFRERPGFTAFPSGRDANTHFDGIKVNGFR